MQQAGDYKQKRAKFINEKENQKDFINQLPDEIPTEILSKLSIYEAARTSILSRKWRHLWKHFSGTLEFNGSHVMKDMEKDIEKASGRRKLKMAMEIMYDAESQTYTNLVNEVLSSLKSQTLEGLRFWFHVGNDCDIDKLVQFAIHKKVKRLDFFFGHSSEYVLPVKFFQCASFDSLCFMKLKSINLTNEMLEYLLCCCPLLESLSLVSSGIPESMTVSSSGSSSLRLKSLEFVRCWVVKNLELVAENLTSFKYFGQSLDIEFKRVPSLVEATFGGAYVDFIRDSFVSQMKVLKLDITDNLSEMNYWLENQLPDLRNLKQLELVAFYDEDGVTFSTCALLLKASPSLWRLKIKMLNMNPSFRTERKFTRECEYSLNELELVGFCGATSEVELVMHVLENATELKKITIDTRLPDRPKWRHVGGNPRIWDHEQNKKHAMDLQKKIPTLVEFIYL